MSAMRILWLSPWMRPLARVHTEALMGRGASVLLVTTDQHPESGPARDHEMVLEPSLKHPAGWASWARAVPKVRAFRPDVVITELVRDPRWQAFGAGRPRVLLVHDDRPHDASEERPRWKDIAFRRWESGAVQRVAFSDYVARQIAPHALSPVGVVPLTSDLDPQRVPPFVPASGRRDFVLVGRLNGYKNVDVILRAWEAHVAGPAWHGDHLVLIGNGEFRGALPESVRWIRGPYSYDDVLQPLSTAKASVVHYRQASQSGVQTLSMQLGVNVIVSTEGALPEFQPHGEIALGRDDVAGLTAAFDRHADPVAAASFGAVAREHYLQNFTADHAAGRLLTICERLPRPH
ncbi:glycosyltransferase family 4 protein [Mycobacteroides sp. LB1]|nr:glycosyltransferase family 4 protein [Mycobacteroides sp. LB1]